MRAAILLQITAGGNARTIHNQTTVMPQPDVDT